ncbi:hypothetical protein [Yinghuangia seranimata]|uniref:hypothetical protein n=1 Tax=Yinghuangia seranimata TaxID=408067 RepID=UPI00248B60FE|nr:hypothetical protein [Yinghuangia seranimata]MDI2132824.1 hypothetical protein [Yinghuangia seranimata]
MSEPASQTSPDLVSIASRFNGPPGSGNGGYVGGLLAQHLEAGSGGIAGVTVTLRQPPPLERALKVVDEGAGTFRLYDGDLLVAEAAPAGDDVLEGPGFEPVDPVPFEPAAESSAHFLATHSVGNPYATCFVCGTDRAEGDGLRLFPGMLPQRPGVTACAWEPDASLTAPDGAHVRPEFVWAALDCPGGWTAMDLSTPLLLGRLTVRIDAVPFQGERCVVMGRLLGRDGRKVRTATTLYDGDGRVAAQAEALWIAPRTDPA